MLVNLVFRDTSLHPPHVDEVAMQVVARARPNFLPNFNIVAVFKKHVVCFLISAHNATAILNQHSLYCFDSVSVVEALIKDCESLALKQITFHNVPGKVIRCRVGAKSDHLRPEFLRCFDLLRAETTF